MTKIDLGKVAIKHKGTWSALANYEPLDFVYYSTDGCGYIAVKNNTNVVPGTDATTWNLSVAAGRDGESVQRQVITYSSSDTVVNSMAWDKIHLFPEMSSLSFTLANIPNDNVEHQVTIIFDTPSDITDFVLNPDAGVLWPAGSGLPTTVEPSTRYEINISSSDLLAVYVSSKLN